MFRYQVQIMSIEISKSYLAHQTCCNKVLILLETQKQVEGAWQLKKPIVDNSVYLKNVWEC